MTAQRPRKGSGLIRELTAILDEDSVVEPPATNYLQDATESRGLTGRLDAVALPRTTAEVAAIVAWCYAHDVLMLPRGGGTGFAGGAVPIDGGVVLSLERLNRIRSFDPLLWRIHLEAGVRTSELRRRATENGLLYPPDPGAGEQSQIGGNIATNAGGPHAFKYGVTGSWITGLEAVVAPGEAIRVGGPIRKDVSGYDLKSLLIGSEGTLGVITAAWVKLCPAPECALPVLAAFTDTPRGCSAIEAVLGNGLSPAALEFLDGATLGLAAQSLPFSLPATSRFVVIAEADGSREEAGRVRDELVDVLSDDALVVIAPHDDATIADLWRWREGVSIAVNAQRGGKVSEDIVVPVDRLAEAIEGTLEIGRRHSLEACSWGHAGDGNLHATFLISPDDSNDLDRARLAAGELFGLAIDLGGSISGEHGLGWVKSGQLERQWSRRAVGLHSAIKETFDPKNLFNPGKKHASTGIPDLRGAR